jgi:hypothetical protein
MVTAEKTSLSGPFYPNHKYSTPLSYNYSYEFSDCIPVDKI